MCDRRKAHDKDQIVSPGRGPADKAENTAVRIVGVDPAEALVPAVIRVERLVFPVHHQEIPDIGLEMLVFLVPEKEPVNFPLLTPLPVLTDVLRHKEQLLAGMSEHICVPGLQIFKFFLILARHLADHGTLQMHNLVMREHQDIILAECIGHGECHLVVIKLAEIRIQLHVLQKIMHPSHVPLKGKT